MFDRDLMPDLLPATTGMPAGRRRIMKNGIFELINKLSRYIHPFTGLSYSLFSSGVNFQLSSIVYSKSFAGKILTLPLFYQLTGKSFATLSIISFHILKSLFRK